MDINHNVIYQWNGSVNIFSLEQNVSSLSMSYIKKLMCFLKFLKTVYYGGVSWMNDTFPLEIFDIPCRGGFANDIFKKRNKCGKKIYFIGNNIMYVPCTNP